MSTDAEIVAMFAQLDEVRRQELLDYHGGLLLEQRRESHIEAPA